MRLRANQYTHTHEQTNTHTSTYTVIRKALGKAGEYIHILPSLYLQINFKTIYKYVNLHTHTCTSTHTLLQIN